MDFYGLMKFLHVLSAIAWVGGGVTLFALGLFAEMRKDDATVMQVATQSAFLSTRWFIPTSLSTLVFGVIAAGIAGIWGYAWVIIGLLGFAGTFAIGMLMLKPLSENIAKLSSEGRVDEAKVEVRKILQTSKFDYTLLTVVIAAMTLKPDWHDWLFLLLLVVILVIAAVLFLDLWERLQKFMPAKTSSES